MIRMLFAMFVTLAGFAAAALWMARGGDAREVVEEILPAEVRSAVRSEVRDAVERFDLEEVASRLPNAVASRLPDPAPKTNAPGDAIAAVDAGEPAEPPKPEVAEEAVEERDLSPRAEFARDLGSAAEDAGGDEDGEETAIAVAANAWNGEGDANPPREPDQDEWASLIRRMLAVYRQTRAVE
jgi:type IV secretory pathway VirB10-like protein